MADGTEEARSATAFRAVLGLGLLVSLAANLPGHMSVDSVIALEEAYTGERQTWAPAAFSGTLKVFDHLLGGTGLYVAASSALLFASLMSLTGLRRGATWMAVLLALGVVLLPQILIYQGIVWRDVLFANVSIAGFLLLAGAARDWRARPWLRLAGALLCLALGAAVRQNGIVVAAAAAAALGWTARGGGWRSSFAWGLGGFLAVVVVALGVNASVKPKTTAETLRPDVAPLILQHYDIVGAVAHEPALALDEIAAANPAAAAQITALAPKVYSAARVDTLDRDPTFRRALWHLPDAAVRAQWRDVVLHHPGAYLAHRADVFGWLIAPPRLEECLPVEVGVTGPADMIDDLGVQAGRTPRDEAVAAYARRFYATPVYSHLTYALLAIAVAGLLLLRRDPADWIVVGMLGGALAFAASFFVISVACDYRYLYLVDLAALTGLLYLAVDPPWGPRRVDGRRVGRSG